MNPTCFYPKCTKKASMCCECSSISLFSCVNHLSSHTSTPGVHNPKKIPELPLKNQNNGASLNLIKCDNKSCLGLAKVRCGCLEVPNNLHNIEVITQAKVTYEDTIHPLDVFLRRAQCDSNVITKVKAKNISIREILTWDMRTLNSMTEYLGLSSTMKYLLWEEINYIKIVTEKYHLKNDYMSRLIFGVDDDPTEPQNVVQ